jgi:histone-lysine N-methyltransferase SETD3
MSELLAVKQSAEDTQVAEVSNELNALKNLIAYCLEKGSTISDDIEFKGDDHSGIGVFTSKECSKGDVLISVPLGICISVETISQYSKLNVIFEDNPSILEYPDEVLAIGLMYAITNPEDTNCPWSQHVATLPRRFNTPLFWSEDELNDLKGHTLFHLSKMLSQRISSDFDSIHVPLSSNYPELLGRTDQDVYVWALSVVYSRALDITRGSSEHLRVIVPVLDMLNHSPQAATSATDTFHFDEEKGEVQYRAGMALGSGEECLAVYGNYCNAKLLFSYGFAIRNNPVQAIDLWTRLSPQSFAADYKARLLSQEPLTAPGQTFDFTGSLRPHFVHPRLLATVRVIQATADELPRVMNAFRGKIVSVRNETATYRAIKELVTLRLQPEQAERERRELGEMLLSSVSSSNRKFMAYVVKVEERELLQVK